MSDDEKRAHDLAMLIVTNWFSHGFELPSDVIRKGDGNKKREVTAASVLSEYEFYYDYFNNSLK